MGSAERARPAWDRFRPPQAMQDRAAVVARALRSAPRILIEGHTDPDGDVCGSCLGLAQGMRELGHAVEVYSEQPYPHAFSWLPGATEVCHELAEDERFDATVVLDAGDLGRVGKDSPSDERRGTLIWVDHHPNSEPPGDVNYVDPDAAAVGEQVWCILGALGHAVSPPVARCIYAALVSDTGSFRYANTSPRALVLAAELLALGVDAWEMTERIYESQPMRSTWLAT